MRALSTTTTVLMLLVLCVNGQLFPTSHPLTWGSNLNGRTGLGSNQGNTLNPTNQFDEGKYSSGNIAAASMGKDHGLSLSTDGAVYSWGSNDHGQLGASSPSEAQTPIEVDTSSITGTITSVYAGSKVSLVLTSSNNIWYVTNQNGFFTSQS